MGPALKLRHYLAGIAVVVLVAACGGGGGGSASGTTTGTPNLKGATLTFSIGSDPTISDTTAYLVVKQLRAWGATVTLDNLTGDPEAVRTVLSGQADVGFVAVSSIVNAGLIAFGPSAPRVDYFMAGGKNLSNINQLPGHSFAVSNTHGLEALMLKALESKYNIDPTKVNVVISGGAGVRGAALLAGKIDATFVHFDGWITLKANGFNELSAVATDLPQLADSYMATSPAFLKAHPDLAIAIDEAWLKAAHVFETSQADWVAAAQEYTKNAQPDADAIAAWTTLQSAKVWPDDGSGFGSADLQYNQDTGTQTGAITTSGVSLANWSDTTAWKAAVKAVLNK